MGLPVWRAPSPEPKDAVKADLTAPARSPIRRRSPFAGRRARPTRSPRSPRLLENDFLASASRYSRPQTASRLSHSLRPPPPPVPESRNYSRQGDSAQDTADVVPDDERLARMRRERYYSSMWSSSRPTFGEPAARSSRPLPALTPNFAPAAASRSSRAQDEPSRNRLRSTSPERGPASLVRPWTELASAGNRDTFVLISDGDEDSSGDNAVGFPPLRRMGRRTIADGPLPSSSLRESWSPATSLDGLGDRERSVSPVDDHWDTMLSTVIQDPVAPTAESSFASTAASASFSNSGPSSRAGSANSNSASSSRTHLTVPSRRASGTELFLRACDTSDDDTASDTEPEEDVEASFVRRRRPLNPPMYARRSGPLYGAEEPPTRDPSRYSRGVRDRTRDATAYVRSLYTSESQRPGQAFSGHSTRFDGLRDEHEERLEREQELREARDLLIRLTERSDVGDDFWASVGLTRPLADRIERTQPRERL